MNKYDSPAAIADTIPPGYKEDYPFFAAYAHSHSPPNAKAQIRWGIWVSNSFGTATSVIWKITHRA